MLVPLTADELRAAGDSIVTEASGLGDSVIVLGLSMGGTVSAWVAQYRVVRRVVLVAPAIEPGRIPAIIDRPIIGLATHIPNVTRGDVPDTTRPDRELGFSSRAAAEVLELGTSVLREARHMSPRTTQMTLLVNANDRTINSRTAKTLAQRWAGHGASVSVFEFPDSLRLPHNILDPPHGSTSGTVILDLLRDLAYGARPSSLATQVLLRK